MVAASHFAARYWIKSQNRMEDIVLIVQILEQYVNY